MNETKSFIESKTLWVNVLWIVAGFVRARFGYTMTPEIEALVLGAINAVLRFVTKQPIAWS